MLGRERKKMVDICLLGTGGMLPMPNRFLTSLMLRYNGEAVLLDCGEATQIAMKKRGWTPRQISVICITHFHADHISGLPGMLLSMGNADRTEDVLIIGPKGIQRVAESLMIICPKLPFKIKFHELTEDEESLVLSDRNMPNFTITAFKVLHNITCYGYSFSLARNGKFDALRAKELGIDIKYWNPLQKGRIIELEDGRKYTPDMVLGSERKGLKITYATDTRPCKSIEKNAKGADLFICEGMYGGDDKLKKAKDHMHMTMNEAANIAKKANPKQMWFTHYSPSMINPSEFYPEVKKIFAGSVIAKDGRTLTLKFSEEE